MSSFFLYRNAWRYDGPPHEEPKLQENEWKALLRKGGLLVRNTYDFDREAETPFWYVIKDRFEGFDELSPRVRNKVRHALSFFDYQPISFDTLGNVYPILKETFDHYSVHDRNMDTQVFERYLSHCKERSFDYWGIFEKATGQLVGFCTVNNWKTSCEYGLSAIRTLFKSNGYYPYYGMYYVLNQHYLQNLGFKYVSDGTRSITEHSNIHEFLMGNFNFRKAYCRLAVYYPWWMRLSVKMLYPFRDIMPVPQVKAILNMESMKRKTEN